VRGSAILLLLSLGGVVFEGIGLGMFLPIFQFMELGGDPARLAASGRHWQIILGLADFIALRPSLAFLVAISFTALVVRQAFNFLRTRYKAVLLYRAIDQMRQRLFRATLETRLGAAQDDLLGKIVNDVAVELPKAMNALYGVIALISRILLIVMYLVGLFFLSPVMALASLAVVAIAGTMLAHLIGASRRTGRTIMKSNRRFTAFLVERLRSLRLIRLSGTEAAEIANLAKLSAKQRDSEIRLKTIAAKLETLMEPLGVLVGFAFLYFGYAYLGLAIGTLGMFFIVLMRLLPASRELLNTYSSILGNWFSLSAIAERLDAVKRAREPKGGIRQFAGLERAIVFENVSYNYPTREVPALDGLTLSMPAAKLTAVVGPSGGGKSTLIDLIPRLRDPSGGTILFDGVPLEEFSIASLRAGISFVPQAPFLFNVPIAEHIRYGRTDASDDEVRAAADLAGAAAFIARLPQGYATPCGEGGEALSAGQRQRIDLARALLRGSRILILDEPTSALDAEAEQAFRASLARLRGRGGLTTIVVAHRLETVADADHVIVLDRGRLIEAGSPEHLLRREGWYAAAIGRRSPRVALAVGS
jgi:ABC-type multidrug transport system fused ATPase/permease subunit